MQLLEARLQLSATDLSNHVGCRHLTNLSLRVARGELKSPVFNDPRLDALKERGAAARPRVVAFFTNGSFDGIIGKYVSAVRG